MLRKLATVLLPMVVAVVALGPPASARGKEIDIDVESPARQGWQVRVSAEVKDCGKSAEASSPAFRNGEPLDQLDQLELWGYAEVGDHRRPKRYKVKVFCANGNYGSAWLRVIPAKKRPGKTRTVVRTVTGPTGTTTTYGPATGGGGLAKVRAMATGPSTESQWIAGAGLLVALGAGAGLFLGWRRKTSSDE